MSESRVRATVRVKVRASVRDSWGTYETPWYEKVRVQNVLKLLRMRSTVLSHKKTTGAPLCGRVVVYRRVTDVPRQSADSPLLQLSTTHQVPSTRTCQTYGCHCINSLSRHLTGKLKSVLNCKLSHIRWQ